MEHVQNEPFFDNLKGMLRPEELSKKTGFSVKTIYNWRYTSTANEKVPMNLFVKFRGKLFIRADVFKDWISSTNPDLDWSQF